MKTIHYFFNTTALFILLKVSWAQHTHLHLNPKWEQCSFQLDSSLTQSAFNQFSKEAGLVVYHRPLMDAKPLGKGHFDLSIVQTKTRIDEDKEAWNDTFVHPDSTHWLIDGPALPIPGLMLRAGVTNKIDAGIFWTKSFGANYSICSGQIQYNFLNKEEKGFYSSARVSAAFIYGPKDIRFSTYGIDLIGSKSFKLYKSWLSISPYLGASSYMTRAIEKSDVVNLNAANKFGAQAFGGALLNVWAFRIAAEYNFSKVPTYSMRIGATFNFNKSNK